MLVSKKHGLNPSMMLCCLCGKEKGIALLGRLPKDAEAPRSAVYDNEPCDECKTLMKQGIILIQVKDDDPDYRLGGFAVITVEAALKIFPENFMEKRAAFVADSLWKQLFN